MKTSKKTITLAALILAALTSQASLLAAPSPAPDDATFPLTVGDVDGDGKITISDAVCITNYLVTSDTKGMNLKAADMNNDGKISKEDADLVIKKWLAMGKNSTPIDDDDVVLDSKERR